MWDQPAFSLVWNIKPINWNRTEKETEKISSSIMSRNNMRSVSDEEVSSVPRSIHSATAPRQRPPPPPVAPSGSKKARMLPVTTDAIPSSSSSRKRKTRIVPATVPKKPSLYELFGTDSEDEFQEPPARKHGRSREDEQRKTPQHRSISEGRDSRKQARECYPPPPPPPSPRAVDLSTGKTSARDVFGSDSDDDRTAVEQLGKKSSPLISHYSKRIPHGVSRQSHPNKEGSHYVELKVYNSEEIKYIQPMNRWRHAIITVKNRTNDNTEAWQHLTDFIKATRREFKDCAPDIFNA